MTQSGVPSSEGSISTGEGRPSRAGRFLNERSRRASSRVDAIHFIAASLTPLATRAVTRGAGNMTEARASKAEENAPRKSMGRLAHTVHYLLTRDSSILPKASAQAPAICRWGSFAPGRVA
jgi:hypothetical protein